MKNLVMTLTAATALTMSVQAGPLRIAVIDFVDQTGMKSDAKLGGALDTGKLADKGVFVLGKQLVGNESFTLIDRRDFINQIERLRPKDLGESSPMRPSFLQAAQALDADLVLRGNILSLSTGKQTINQGGYRSEMATVGLRVSLEALDATDGAVIAITDGTVRRSFRQTDAFETELSEDDILGMMEEALAQAVPGVEKSVMERQDKLANRPKAGLSIKSTDDPAMVEIDGLLIGSTPIDNFQVYLGDHTMTISKPGYQQINKKILVQNSLAIEVPLLREKLSAEELKEIYEKGELSIIQTTEPNLIIKSIE